MGKASAIISVIAAVAVGVALASCSSSGCTDNQNSLPMAGFYSSSSKSAISVGYLDVYGVGSVNDSMLYSSGQALNIVYLPFRNSANETSYVFHYTQQDISGDEYNDTLTFGYESLPYFASEECGAMYRYDIKRLDYTRHLIDSVVITDSLITNTDVERVKIYFRTSSDD